MTNASLLFNGEDIKKLNTEEDWNTKEYIKVYNILKSIYILNIDKGFKENHIYILKPLPEENKTIFVAHLPGDSSKPYNVGNIELMMDTNVNYMGDEFLLTPEMKRIINKEISVASTNIYEDQHGTWISAYAPILDNDNNVVAILETDYDIHFVMDKIYERYQRIFFTILIISLISYFIMFIFSFKFIHPISQLMKAINEISRGNYDFRISVNNNYIKDEFDILKQTFNNMIISIAEKIRLSQYVSKKTIQKVQYEIKEKKALTSLVNRIIVFTDIRGFTKFSENRSPELQKP